MKSESSALTRRNSPPYNHRSLSLRLLLVLLVLLSAGSPCRAADFTDPDSECMGMNSVMECISRLNRTDVEGNLASDIGELCIETKYVAVGEEIQLTCVQTADSVEFLGWDVYPSKSTMRTSITFEQGSRFTNETNILTIKNVMSGDEGLYVCIVNQDDSMVDVIRVAGCLIVHASVIDDYESAIPVTATLNEDITLPAAITFDNAGFCGVTPKLQSARLRFNSTDNIFLCQEEEDCDFANTFGYNVTYNLAEMGDVTISSTPNFVNGLYILSLAQCCPQKVLQITYNVTSGVSTVISSTKVTPPSPSVLPPGGTRKDNAAIIGSTVAIIILVAVTIVLVVAFILLQKKGKPFRYLFKDPVYEEPHTISDKLHSPLERHESDYTLPPPVRDDRGLTVTNGHYGEPVYLADKITDSEEARI